MNTLFCWQIGKWITRSLLSPIALIQAALDRNLIVERAGFNYRELYWRNRLKRLGKNSLFYPNVTIHFPENVSMGSGSSVAEFTHIWGRGGVEIGDNVLIASHAIITSQTHDATALVMRLSQVDQQVIIENNVWIGSNAIILPGVHIGAGSIVGAGSVVTHDIPSNSVVAGVPARFLKDRKVITHS
ncbi:MAG TPA: acyltransferase [Anaerolineales bacterium]|jgi:maltose O-acetyltransferase|nr:acyltransferase [Anaerolineales bacterium]